MANKKEQHVQKRKLRKNSAYLDKSEPHYKRFRDQLAAIGLMLRDVPGDGNCMFRALGDQLEGHSENHLQHREETVQYIQKHRESFEPFMEDDVNFERYVTELKVRGTYGGHHCLVAFSRLHKLNIVIHQLNVPVWQIETPGSSKQLHLSYHNNEHYASVRYLNDTNSSPANVQLNVDQKFPTLSSNCQQHSTKHSTASCSSSFVESTSFWSSEDGVTDEFLENTGETSVCALSDDVKNVMLLSGCNDETLVMDTLEDCQYNVELAVDHLLNLTILTQTSSSNNTTSTSTQKSTERCSPKAGVSVKTKPHLTNKQRKEQHRREKAQRTAQRKAEENQFINQENTDNLPVIDCLTL